MGAGRRPGLIRSIALAPFELAFGFVTVWSGVSGLFDWTPQAVLFSYGLPQWLATMSNLLYTVSGLAIIGGHMRHLREIEIFGLVLVLSSLVVRVGVLTWTAGFTPQTNNSIILAAVFAIATVIRLWVMFTHRTILLVEPSRTTDIGVEGVVGKAV